MLKTIGPNVALRTAALAMVVLALVIHMICTLLVTLPNTPVTVRVGSLLTRYMYPYFSQNWSFFAPNPPVKDDYVLAQYNVRSAHGAQTSTWINLSRTFNAAARNNRATPLEIVQLTLLNAYDDVLGDDRVFHKGRLVPGAMKRLANPAELPPALHTLDRVAMAYFPRAGIGGRLVSVRIAMFHHEFPRFNHREEKDDMSKHNSALVFPAVPAEPVAPL